MIIYHPSNKQIHVSRLIVANPPVFIHKTTPHQRCWCGGSDPLITCPWQWMVSWSSLKKRSGWNKWPSFCYLWGATCCVTWSRCWGVEQRIIRPSNIQGPVDIVCLIHLFFGAFLAGFEKMLDQNLLGKQWGEHLPIIHSDASDY